MHRYHTEFNLFIHSFTTMLMLMPKSKSSKRWSYRMMISTGTRTRAKTRTIGTTSTRSRPFSFIGQCQCATISIAVLFLLVITITATIGITDAFFHPLSSLPPTSRRLTITTTTSSSTSTNALNANVNVTPRKNTRASTTFLKGQSRSRSQTQTQIQHHQQQQRRQEQLIPIDDHNNNNDDDSISREGDSMTRRSMILNQITKATAIVSATTTLTTLTTTATFTSPLEANAAVGSLPEFDDSNAVLQGVTIDVSDVGQQNSMIDFLRDGLQFKLLRQRKVGSVTETVRFYVFEMKFCMLCSSVLYKYCMLYVLCSKLNQSIKVYPLAKFQ